MYEPLEITGAVGHVEGLGPIRRDAMKEAINADWVSWHSRSSRAARRQLAKRRKRHALELQLVKRNESACRKADLLPNVALRVILSRLSPDFDSEDSNGGSSTRTEREGSEVADYQYAAR